MSVIDLGQSELIEYLSVNFSTTARMIIRSPQAHSVLVTHTDLNLYAKVMFWSVLCITVFHTGKHIYMAIILTTLTYKQHHV